MTNSEAINLLDNLIGMVNDNHDADYDGALRMAIKALEQEPCEDAISRQAMHIELEKWITYGEYEYSNATKYLYDRIDRLPSVTPQPKTGEWIEHFDESGKWCECDQCHTDWGGAVNFCPNCGAKMV